MVQKAARWSASLSAVVLVALMGIRPVGANEQPEGEEIDRKPYAPGDMELGAGLGFSGGGDYFSLTIAGNFAYYVIPRLAPGIDLQYTVIWGDLEYPQSFTVLPFLKYVLIRSYSFAPYLVLTGGRDFQWGGTTNPFDGFAPVGAWIFGGGAGAQIGVSRHFGVRIALLALYYIYDETVVLAGDDEPVDGKLFFPVLAIGLVFNLQP